MKQRVTTEQYIAKARKIHGDKYDYSKVVYTKAVDPIIVTCPIHGDFTIKAIVHISHGQGCPECSKENQSALMTDTLESFLQKAREKHGDKYDYSKVVYAGSQVKVEIGCPDHGTFWQVPASHIAGNGCRACGILSRTTLQRKDTATFIAESKKLHVDKNGLPLYGYDRTSYVTAHTPVELWCKVHKEYFRVTPNAHLRYGRPVGCAKCSRNHAAKLNNLGKEEFIARSKMLWGKDTFDYSSVMYINQYCDVLLKCNEHTIRFKQFPANHLKGRYGCPICRAKSTLPSKLYVIHCTGNGEEFYKVGVTRRMLVDRFAGMSMPYDFTIVFIKSMPANEAYAYESDIKRNIAEFCRYSPRVPFLGSSTECFSDVGILASFFPDFTLSVDPLIDTSVTADVNS